MSSSLILGIEKNVYKQISKIHTFLMKKVEKKLFVLRCENFNAGSKIAREVKDKHEKLWGKDTCEVVVLAKDSLGDSYLEVIPKHN